MRVVGFAHGARSPRFRIAEGCIGGMVQQDLCCAHAWNVVVTVWSVSLFACSAIEGFFSLLLFKEMHSCSSFVSNTVHFKVVRVLFFCSRVRLDDSYLVDPASSHMLVSKIKPCMSKYKLLYTVKLRMAH